MYVSEINLRIRYAETDRMGYCYYGNYAQFFEVARVEALRDLGISYRRLEDEGFLLPVTHFSIDYFKPAYYDDQIRIKCIVKELPGVKVFFQYETYNIANECLNKAKTTLVFIDSKSHRPIPPPQSLITKFAKHFIA